MLTVTLTHPLTTSHAVTLSLRMIKVGFVAKVWVGKDPSHAAFTDQVL